MIRSLPRDFVMSAFAFLRGRVVVKNFLLHAIKGVEEDVNGATAKSSIRKSKKKKCTEMGMNEVAEAKDKLCYLKISRHLLIAFGGLASLEECFEEDKNLKGKKPSDVFHSYLNVCPNQGSRTIRTEGDESVAAEKLRQLNLNSSTTSKNLISGKECREVPSANQSLVGFRCPGLLSNSGHDLQLYDGCRELILN